MKSAIDDTVEYVKLLAQRLGGCSPNCVVLVILMDLGIPVNHVGFEYLKEAILLQYEDPVRDLENDIFPAIAAKYGDGTISNKLLETAIRSVIRSAWSRTQVDVWQKYIPSICSSAGRPPTNTEVISGLARIVELWQGCADAYMRQKNREVISCGTE